MTNVNNIPTWAGSADTMARRVNPIIHLIAMGKSVSPSAISDLVRPAGSTKDYSAKYITFLRLLGFDFSVQKDGRKIVSYTCITEPKNAADIRAIGPKTSKAKAAKVAKAAAPKVAKPKAVKTVKPAVASKSVAAIKAKNLEVLKSVGAKQAKAAKRVREFDDVTEQFGNSGEIATSYNVDRDWDSIEGLDLQKLVG